MPTCLITGATGFIGSHLAEACAQRGWPVRALVRAGSDSTFLRQLGVKLIPGDLLDPGPVREAVRGADVVLHCAAKVGDWGPVDDYRRVNVEALGGLLEACRGQPIGRFVHFSSLGVYEARDHHGTDESEPPPEQHVDGYTQTKVEAEQLVLKYHRDHGLPVVILRPGFVYGPRDRTVLPRLIENLRNRMLRYLGSGRQAMNCIYIGNLVEAVFLALDRPAAVGQVYNLTDGEPVSKRRFIGSLASGVGVRQPPPVPVPMWLARMMACWMEWSARKANAPESPRLTQARLKLLGLNLDFSIAKARRELGYQPKYTFEQGMALTTAWSRERTRTSA